MQCAFITEMFQVNKTYVLYVGYSLLP